MDPEKLAKALEEVAAHLRGEIELPVTVFTAADLEGHRAGMNLDDHCPYSEGTPEHKEWWNGHDAAVKTYGSY